MIFYCYIHMYVSFFFFFFFNNEVDARYSQESIHPSGDRVCSRSSLAPADISIMGRRSILQARHHPPSVVPLVDSTSRTRIPLPAEKRSSMRAPEATRDRIESNRTVILTVAGGLSVEEGPNRIVVSPNGDSARLCCAGLCVLICTTTSYCPTSIGVIILSSYCPRSIVQYRSAFFLPRRIHRVCSAERKQDGGRKIRRWIILFFFAIPTMVRYK